MSQTLPAFDPRLIPVLPSTSRENLLPARADHLTEQGLRERFARPPDWTPELWREVKFADRAPAQAAVLLPLVMHARPTLLLTQRTAHLSTHSGQIALPGGKVDATDTDAVDAALREAEEEIGLPPGLVEVVGPLSTLVSRHGIKVTPYVGLVPDFVEYRPNDGEIAAVFAVPLAFFREAIFEHHLDEERDLFPAVLASAQPGAERERVRAMTERLTHEHRAIETLWKSLEKALKRVGKGQDADLDVEDLRQLVAAYAAHAGFEETEFLPLSETILGRNSNHMAALGLSLHMRHAKPVNAYI